MINYYLVILMLPSLNVDERDPKLKLLAKILEKMDSDYAVKIYARNGIRNIKMMVKCIFINFTSIFYDYPVTKVIDELNSNFKLKKFLNIQGEIPSPEQVVEYISRYSSLQFCNIVNSLFSRINKSRKRRNKHYIVDATSVACDINHLKEYIPPSRLEKLGLEWGFSKSKGYYIGFKVTAVLDEETLCPVSILIHPGAPNDSKLFEPILKELDRRQLIKPSDIILFDRGYYSKINYSIGINKYKIIPLIFPKKCCDISKLENYLSYPLEAFKSKKDEKRLKRLFKSLKTKLIGMLNNWKDFKPIRGKIEDFFKVSKNAFGLDLLHKYTSKSVHKTVYLSMLVTTLAIQEGYNSKTGMQQLSEGILEQKKRKKSKKKKSEEKEKINEKLFVPYESQQQLPFNKVKEVQTTLKNFIKI